MIDAICNFVTPERLQAAVSLLNLPPDLGRNLTLVRAALCGDPAAAGKIERLALETPGCGCRGCAVGALKGALAATGTTSLPALQFPAARAQLPATASVQFPAARAQLPLDWHCRTSTGDVSGCELRKLAQDRYPSFESRLEPLEGSDPSLPPAPAGYRWHFFSIPPIPVSRTLCLESASVFDLAGQPLVPARLGIRGEELATENGEIFHAYGNPELPPKKGWEVTDGRCRCLQPPCLCLPAGARAQFLALLPALEVGFYGLSLELAADNFGLAVCEPCEPGPLCDRPPLNRCDCAVAVPDRPAPVPGGSGGGGSDDAGGGGGGGEGSGGGEG